MEQEYFTPREIAKRLRVDDATVRHWIKTGALEAETIRQGKRNRHRIRRATIETMEAPSPIFLQHTDTA
ncbi:MAG TPA: helix-turn-helix domain-containing protein [Ktedonobacteraceae bacterium]